MLQRNNEIDFWLLLLKYKKQENEKMILLVLYVLDFNCFVRAV